MNKQTQKWHSTSLSFGLIMFIVFVFRLTFVLRIALVELCQVRRDSARLVQMFSKLLLSPRYCNVTKETFLCTKCSANF